MRRVLFAILVLIFLLPVASALTVSVTGNCLNKQVKVTTDQEAMIIFRINSGTPIFASASPSNPAYFIPRVEGELNVTAIAGDETSSTVIQITECSSSSSGGGSKYTYTLPSGTFDVLGKEVQWRTAYGALKKAAEILHFTITPELTEWGIFVKCIKSLCKGDIGETSGWMYWVNYPNDPLPGVAATDFRVNPGDVVVWYFSRSMSETPESSPYKIQISLGDNYEVYVSIVWPKKVSPFPEFTFTPQNPMVGEEVTFNASKSSDDGEIISYLWDFGDGRGGEGVVVTHTYTQPGTYRVELTVVDDDGLSSSISKNVTVTQPESVLNMSYPLVLKPGNAVNVSVSEEVAENLSITGLWVDNRDRTLKISLSKANTPPGVIYGTIYSCFDLEVNSTVDVKIRFKVPRELAEGREVVMMKFNGSWIDIPTERTGEDEKYLYYAAEVSDFSIFAVTIKWSNFPLNASDERIVKALKWLRSIQNDDGGFANPDENCSVAKTSWAVMAIVAAGQSPHEWRKNGNSPIDFMREKLKDEIGVMGTADYARTILALVYADENPRNFAGFDLVNMLKSKMKENGQIGDFVYTTIWGMLALSAVGEDVSKSAEWLKTQQNPDGGFSWNVGEKSDFDDTAAAIQALIAAGEPKDSKCILKALDYLKEGQNDDGGMRYFGNSASNAASDAWAIQALVAAGINPAEWMKNNHSVVEHLLSLQTEEGYFMYTDYQTSNPGYMTVSAIMALLGKPHPIKVTAASSETSINATAGSNMDTETATTTVNQTEETAAVTATVTATQAEKSAPGFLTVTALLAALAAAGLKGRKRE
ncbi:MULTISPECIES: PKD domain-containing protein [unclassified Archaeoglobus]|mgnify:CR=1 FL=1|jgi:PKD repeat protein|uniref:PKD domain-containing protein n=1 Tax=unclassified Archaeoglobus TaxID=2643606 RepID=UPI0025C32C66|nr:MULTISPECIES: PKD domain-containing protein [unclassified Archaeoglobus]